MFFFIIYLEEEEEKKTINKILSMTIKIKPIPYKYLHELLNNIFNFRIQPQTISKLTGHILLNLPIDFVLES